MQHEIALEAIRKKLKGQQLSAKEIFAIMDELAHNRLNSVLTTYFMASFSKGFSDDELYELTKSMAETGEKLNFKGLIADKHSVGGLSGTRVSMILVPIIAAAGIKIPKTSSRAITTPSGTADTMEVLAPVTFSAHEIEKIVDKIGGCIVWGGGVNFAPADDMLIQVERELSFESFDKIIVSVMAKKVAAGANRVVIDIPVGETMKIRHFEDAELIAKKFLMLAKKFGIQMTIDINQTLQPAGNGIGPNLETKDVLEVLEQKSTRPMMLEKRTLRLAGKLLNLCWPDKNGNAIAKEMLTSKKALEKMREIIKAQGGDQNIDSSKIEFGKAVYEEKCTTKGEIESVNNKNVTIIARILGSPDDKKAGILLNRRVGDKIDKNDSLLLLYSSDKWRLKEARDTILQFPIYKICK